mgnify:CR=1 FL=1
MALENKLGLISSVDLVREEERISKKKAATRSNKRVVLIFVPKSLQAAAGKSKIRNRKSEK